MAVRTHKPVVTLHPTTMNEFDEEKYRPILDNINEVVYVLQTTPDNLFVGTVEFASRQAESIIGYAPEEFMHDPGLWASLIHPDDRQAVEQATRQIYASRSSGTREYRVRHRKTGEYRWIEDRVVPQLDDQGNLIGIIGVARDITERKRAEEQLRFQADILRNVHHSVIVTDLAGKIVYWNEGATTVFGYSAEEMLGQTPALLYPDEDLALLAADLERIMEGEDYTGEWKGRRKDGATVWIDIKTTLMRDAEGRAVGFIGVAQDITEHRRAEAALAESEKRFRVLIERSYDAVALISADGTITYQSPTVTQITGFSPDELTGLSIFARLHPDDLPRAKVLLAQVLQEAGLSVSVELRFQHKDGSWRWLEATGTNLLAEASVRAIVANYRDITERKQAEAERTQLVNVLETSLNEIYIFDAESLRFQYVNSGALRNLGYSREAISTLTPLDLKPEFDLASFRNLIGPLLRREKEKLVFHTVHRRGDGSLYPIEVHLQMSDFEGKRVFHAIILDVTERKRAEAQLAYQAQLLANVSDAVVASDENFRLTAWNAAAEALYGWKAEEVLGRNGVEIVRTEFPGVDPEEMRLMIAEADAWQGETTQARKDGLRIPVEVASMVLRDQSGRIKGYVSVNRDITERKRAEAERERLFEQVRESQAQLRALSRRLVETQEAERRRIARELHDEIGQALTGLKLLLEIVAGSPDDAGAVGDRLSRAQALVEQITTQVHDLSLELRPPVLDDLGLLPALLWHFEHYTIQTNVRVTVEHHGVKDRRFAPEVETAVYRIVQEALTNVARHAGVREAVVRLWADQDMLGVQVEDRGRGFDPQAALADTNASGLSGMRERATLLGGHFEIESAPGAGATLTAELPLGGESLERRERAR